MTKEKEIKQQAEDVSNCGGHPPYDGDENQKPLLSLNEKRAARATVLVPLTISLVYCLVKWVFPIFEEMEQKTALPEMGQFLAKGADILIDYFAVTFISTAACLLLQDYVFKVSNYLDDRKALRLAGMFFLYVIVYTLYLVPTPGQVMVKLVLFALSILFVFVLWTSLWNEIRQNYNVFSGSR